MKDVDMFRIYLVVIFVLYCDLTASQNIKCFDNGEFTDAHMNCDENKNNTLQNKYGKKGFQNPYTTEIRFNYIIDESNKN